ncbi:hypothetical protein U1Q18_026389 [Sarracenia purpurea var. burkii]
MKGMRVGSSCSGRLFLLVVVVAAAVVVGVWEVPVVNGASPSECKEERRLLKNECMPVIFGQEPSGACCQRVRVTQVECVCPYVTPKLAALIGVERTIKKIESCGRTVPHNFKCGSVTTPP